MGDVEGVKPGLFGVKISNKKPLWLLPEKVCWMSEINFAVPGEEPSSVTNKEWGKKFKRHFDEGKTVSVDVDGKFTFRRSVDGKKGRYERGKASRKSKSGRRPSPRKSAKSGRGKLARKSSSRGTKGTSSSRAFPNPSASAPPPKGR